MKIRDAASAIKQGTPKILLFDIETTPITAFCWKVWDENISPAQMLAPSELLCFAAKWLGERKTTFRSRLECGKVADSDRGLCQELWELLNSADIVVAHNGKAFDIKTMNARFAAHQLPPPAPYSTVDTCLLARKVFNFPHNSLNGLAKYLGIGSKVEHEGFALWVKCLAGDKAAWSRMRRYNIQDVALLERVYLRLRSWAKHPCMGLLYADCKPRCACCGSTNLVELPATHKVNVSQFRAYRCRVCGKVSRTGSPAMKKSVLRNA